ARRQRGRVRAGAGLGQRVAAQGLARSEPRQPLALLLLAPEPRDRLAGEADVHGDDPTHGRVHAPELLDDERVREHVEPAAAVILVPARAEVAGLAELRDERAVGLLGAIPVTDVRRDLPLGELARRRADQLLLGRQLEAHGGNVTTSFDAGGAMPRLDGK